MPARICYASNPDSLLIRPTGELGKCTSALSHPLKNFGKLNFNGSLRALEFFESLDEKALACP
jgi:hypothetical protein